MHAPACVCVCVCVQLECVYTCVSMQDVCVQASRVHVATCCLVCLIIILRSVPNRGSTLPLSLWLKQGRTEPWKYVFLSMGLRWTPQNCPNKSSWRHGGGGGGEGGRVRWMGQLGRGGRRKGGDALGAALNVMY